jgi:adenylate cyclase
VPGAGIGRRRRWLTRGLLGLALGLVAWIVHLGPAGGALEQRGLDLLFALRGPLPAPDDLVIVAIDEVSFAELGLQWPWPRSLHGRLVARLAAAGARTIAFDVIFDTPSTPAEDDAFEDALAAAGTVVLAADLRVVETETIQQMLRIRPLPRFEAAAAGVGVVSVRREADGVVRVARSVIGEQPSFAWLVAQGGDGGTASPPPPFLINWVGPHPAIRTVSYSRALAPGVLPDATFRDKTVLIGRAAGAAGRPTDDTHFTPYFMTSRMATPGVEIHATIVDTLRRSGPVVPMPQPAALAWTLAWCAGAGSLIGVLGIWKGLGAAGALIVVQGAAALALFSGPQLWLPWVAPTTGIGAIYVSTVALGWRRAEREKAFVRRAFQHYVHPEVVKDILEDPARLRLGGQTVQATVLFADLEGFTRISESLTAEQLIALLNEYLSAMGEVIVAHHGMMNQTLGDGILALWGVPLPNPTHAADACRAALAMQERLTALNEEWQPLGRRPARMRVGIQTGELVAGNVGSRERFNYTCIGDNVNTSARLEGVNKLYGTRICIGEETRRQAGDAIEVRELDLIRVVGRTQPVKIYQCLAEGGRLPAERRALVERFERGLAAYREGRFADALDAFRSAAALDPADGPSRLYIERTERLLVEGAPADWDGVYTAASKEG